MAQRHSARGRLRLAADIGGTFTDVAVFDETTGKLTFGKALSTPRASGRRHLRGRRQGGQRLSPRRRFSCTARPSPSTRCSSAPAPRPRCSSPRASATSTRSAASTGPMPTICSSSKHVPLVERALRFEVNERMLADGEIDTPLDENEIAALGAQAARARHRGRRDPVPPLLSQRRSRAARQGDPREEPSRAVRLRLARTVAGISRVRALLDGRRQRLCRPEGAPLSRRDRRAYARGAASPARSSSCNRPAACTRPSRRRVNASACWNPGRRPASSARRRCAARSASTTPSPSTWAAPPPRPASSTTANR